PSRAGGRPHLAFSISELFSAAPQPLHDDVQHALASIHHDRRTSLRVIWTRERYARAESTVVMPRCDDQDKRRLTVVFDHLPTVPRRSHRAIMAPSRRRDGN